MKSRGIWPGPWTPDIDIIEDPGPGGPGVPGDDEDTGGDEEGYGH